MQEWKWCVWYGLYKIISQFFFSIDQNKIHSLSVLRALINSSKRSCISRTRSVNWKEEKSYLFVFSKNFYKIHFTISYYTY